MSHSKKSKTVVIVGPTASGKTSLSIEIAKKFNGEIISADSRQVYRGMDLGTGKITKEEMDGIPHHLLDVADPNEQYSVADFVKDGHNAIAEVQNNGKLPIITGGTFFYIDALLGRIHAPQVPPDLELRTELEKIDNKTLYTVLLKEDPRRAAEIDPDNKRRLIRALEIIKAVGRVPEQKSEEIFDTLTIGIAINREVLNKNIRTRIQERIDAGMIEEIQKLHGSGVSWKRMDELGLEYRYIPKYITGELSKEEMIDILSTKIHQFAKRQMTWLKRDKTIHWSTLNKPDEIFEIVQTFLTN